MMHEKIKASFQKQGLMKTLGARLTEVSEGKAVIECDFGDHLSQQHGYFHAGAITSVIDTACGYAARTTMPEAASVLSVEFKVNLLRPAVGPKIIAVGEVVKSGKTLVFCEGKVWDAEQETLFATMSATMYCLKPKKS